MGQKVYLKIDKKLIPRLFSLLRQGFEVEIYRRCSIQAFLHEILRIPADYIDNRIQTVFLNGQPVDNLQTVWLKPGETLALSAAMPGLAGAILRKDGHFTAMRHEISYHVGETSAERPQGRVKVKLFNFLPAELGAALLRQGGWVDYRGWEQLVRQEQAGFAEGCQVASVNGEPLPVEALADYVWDNADVFLKVDTPG